jgi:hypothetical protein
MPFVLFRPIAGGRSNPLYNSEVDFLAIPESKPL